MNKILLLILGFPGIGLLIGALATEGLPSPTTLIIPGLIIILLLFFNAIFVAAEFAIISVRPTQVEEMIEAGNKSAQLTMATLISPAKQDRYIATSQLGITIASLGLGMYGEPQIAHFIEPYLALLLGVDPHVVIVHTISYVIALSLLTYLHVVLGEMIPKSLALSSSKRMVLLLNGPMRIMQLFFAVPVSFLNWIGLGLVKLLRVPPSETDELVHSPEELEIIISESVEGGMLNNEEEEWIRNIFSFGDRQVNQVMTPRRKIQAIACDASLSEILQQVSESQYSRFPVYREDLDHIIGILHLKELVRQQIMGESFVFNSLIQNVPVVPEYYPVEQLLSVFKQERIHMAIVLDEFGGTAGIVTLEDLVEEIVGEVRDEFDRELEPLVEVAPGVLEVEGSYLIDDLLDDYDEEINLGDENSLPDVETIGGLIVAHLGRPPEKNDQVVYNEQVRFTVLNIDGLAVARARIEYQVPNQTGNDSAQTHHS
jgi:CBS domain containing-hemolysin-like protein